MTHTPHWDASSLSLHHHDTRLCAVTLHFSSRRSSVYVLTKCSPLLSLSFQSIRCTKTLIRLSVCLVVRACQLFDGLTILNRRTGFVSMYFLTSSLISLHRFKTGGRPNIFLLYYSKIQKKQWLIGQLNYLSFKLLLVRINDLLAWNFFSSISLKTCSLGFIQVSFFGNR